MQTLYLDADLYATSRELHAALKRLLDLPDYYGMNADALSDCLGERAEPLHVYVATPGRGEVARTVQLLMQVVEDAGGTVRHAVQL